MASTEAKMYADSISEKIERIIATLDGRSTEEINMRPPVPETNSLLVLAIHTMGSTEEGVFQGIGDENVGRDREGEFKVTGSSTDEVRAKWADLQPRLQSFIEGLSDEQLAADCEHPRRGAMTARAILLHATTHASEHVGHAELTRDWIDTQK